MDFTAYQHATATTAVYPSQGGAYLGDLTGLLYVTLGLNGEAGEVAEQVKKALRDDNGVITAERREKLTKELGDVLWYLARAAAELDLDLGHVADFNLAKLASRANRGVLAGSGSDR